MKYLAWLGLIVLAGARMVAPHSAPPTIRSFTAAPGALGATGGTVKLTGRIAGATTCVFSGAGVTARVSCRHASVAHTVYLPANQTGQARRWGFTLVAKGPGGTSRTARTTVVEAPEVAASIESVDPGQTITSISCDPDNFCAAVDADGNAMTTADGHTWTAPQAVDPGQDLVSISCAQEAMSAADGCVAVDTVGNFVGYNEDGAGWSPPELITDRGSDQPVPLTAASCGGCVLGDANGDLWAPPANPRPSFSPFNQVDGGNAVFATGISSLSCVPENSDDFCVTVDPTGQAAWGDISTGLGAAVDIDAGHVLTSVSCADGTFCMAVDNNGDAVPITSPSVGVLQAGRPAHIDDDDLASVSCPTGSCAAVDTSGRVLLYDGTTWSPPLDVDTNGFTSVSCAVYVADCYASDDDGNIVSIDPAARLDRAGVHG